MKKIRCCRCGSEQFTLSGPSNIFEDYDSRLLIKCSVCRAPSEGTLIICDKLEFQKEDTNE